MSERNFQQITPVLQVRDVESAVRFFVEVLGFKAWVTMRDYGYVQREGAAVRILLASPDPVERYEYGSRAFLFYVDVRDIAVVVAEVGEKLLARGLPAGEGPVDQTWGQREWWVTGPEGGLVIFGQEIAEMQG